MNTPGRAGGNWTWRYTPDMLTIELAERLGTLTTIYGRAKKAEPTEEPVLSDE
jgi:4-alpha-glucanotransferase